ELADPVELEPPPSKMELVPDIDVMPELQLELTGLRPPGSISVAPSGMPVPDPVAPLEPSMPSGEVAPRPDVVVALCAWGAPQPNSIAAAMRGKSLTERLHC